MDNPEKNWQHQARKENDDDKQNKQYNTTKTKKMSRELTHILPNDKQVHAPYKTPAILLIQSRRVGHHYTQTNTNHTNKTTTLFQKQLG